jgi:hypothetical protein
MGEQAQQRYAGRSLKATEVAAILRVDHRTVLAWCAQGIIENTTVPGTGGRHSYRIAGEVVDKLLQRQETAEDAVPSQ